MTQGEGKKKLILEIHYGSIFSNVKLFRSIKRLYKKYQEIVNGDKVADNNLAETEAFHLELASLQYSMEKQLQMQAVNEKEMQELTQERLKKGLSFLTWKLSLSLIFYLHFI